VSVLTPKRSRRALLTELAALAVVAPLGGFRPGAVAAQNRITTPDGRAYTAYVPAATKAGQFYQYSCEFDASWVVLATFGHDVSFEEQLDIVGHDTSIEPYFEETDEGFIIYGGDITSAFCGDYTTNMLARSTGTAFLPLFEHYGLEARPVATREEIEETLDGGGLVWTKATVDFLPWAETTWLTPSGKSVPTVLGNDHAVVVMGYNDDGVVIRDVLGPTNTNWERSHEYDVPWETFLDVFAAQGSDGVGVLPPEGGETSDAPRPGYSMEPADPLQICC
jgi:Peptidase_C39 like family